LHRALRGAGRGPWRRRRGGRRRWWRWRWRWWNRTVVVKASACAVDAVDLAHIAQEVGVVLEALQLAPYWRLRVLRFVGRARRWCGLARRTDEHQCSRSRQQTQFHIEPSARAGRYTIMAQIRAKPGAVITRARLERIDAPAPRVVEVADIGAQAESNTGADRRQGHVLTPLIIGANAANEIS